MQAYHNISIIENKRRVKALEEFDSLLEEYLSKDLDDGINDELCKRWPEIYEYLLPKYRPNSPSLQLYPLYKFSLYDIQAVGVALGLSVDAYKKNALRAWFNIFNPIWWILQIIGFILRLVVKLLGFIGFDYIQTKNFSKWVESDWARIIIFISTLASGIAAFIYIILIFM
jgi:hypothetical protein